MRFFILFLISIAAPAMAEVKRVDWQTHFKLDAAPIHGSDDVGALEWCLNSTAQQVKNTVCLGELSRPCYNDILTLEPAQDGALPTYGAERLLSTDQMNAIETACLFQEYLAWQGVIAVYQKALASVRPEAATQLALSHKMASQSIDATCLAVSQLSPPHPFDVDVVTATCLRDAAGLYAYQLRSYARFEY